MDVYAACERLGKPYYDDGGGRVVFHGDCRELLPLIEPGSVDVVIADPPYNCGKDYGAHNDSMSIKEFAEWSVDWLSLASAICGNVVFFPGTRNVWNAPDWIREAGMVPYRMLGWHKREFAGDKWTGGPAMSWEPIIWAAGTTPSFNRIYGTHGRDFLVVDATHGNHLAKHHPCPKPLKVVKWLVGLFVPDEGTFVDPFLGTGPTLRAAKDLGRQAIGIEIEERYCEIAANRLAQGVLF